MKQIEAKKIYVQNLIIEVTRKCNMHCAHCMRGDAQNKDLQLYQLTKFLEQIDEIGNITFTGGEPTLNLDAIQHTLNICRKLQIPVSDFYIVTNGKVVSNRFLNLMIDWYTYCISCNGDVEVCGVALSKDEFHEPIPPINEAKLRALSFYRPDDKNTRNWGKTYLLDLGRAREIEATGNVRKRNPVPEDLIVEMYETGIQITEASVTLTAEGDVIRAADYEYENTKDLFISRYDDFSDVIRKIAAQTEPFACDSDLCIYAKDGKCAIPYLLGRQPILTEEDGCLDSEYKS